MVTYIEEIKREQSTDLATTLNPELTKDVELYSQQFLSFAKASTENTIAMCELLNKAKKEFKQKEGGNKNVMFNVLCQSIGYAKGANDPTIKKFVRIGESADRFKPYIDRLPNSWTTLYEITQLDNDLFNDAIDSGAINIKMIGREVKSLKKINQPKQITTVKEVKKPAIEITLDSDDRTLIDAIYKELEVLKFSYKLEINPNDVAKNILENS